jgi:hypothetical protein
MRLRGRFGRGKHKVADFTGFPTNVAAKRYEAREVGFLARAFDETVKTAGRLE